MVFIITELYMSIIMLVSLIILSLKKENYKSLMNMMLLFYIITLVIIYEGIINKNISIFIFNYNLKIDYLTIILKSTVVIFILILIYTLKIWFNQVDIENKKYVVKSKNNYKIKKIIKRFYGKSNVLYYPKPWKKEKISNDFDLTVTEIKYYKPAHTKAYYKNKYIGKDVELGPLGHFLILLLKVREKSSGLEKSFLSNFKSKGSPVRHEDFNNKVNDPVETNAPLVTFKEVTPSFEHNLKNNSSYAEVSNDDWYTGKKNMATKFNNDMNVYNDNGVKNYIDKNCYYAKGFKPLDKLKDLD